MKGIKTNNKGFSLVELIIVIAIMAILVAVLAPQYLKYVEKSRVSRDIQMVDQLYTAVQAACADPNNTYASETITFTETDGKYIATVATTDNLHAALKESFGVDDSTALTFELSSVNWVESGASGGKYNLPTITIANNVATISPSTWNQPQD